MKYICSYRGLQALYEAAKQVLEHGGAPELLRQPVAALETMVALRDTPTGEQAIGRARDLYYQSGDLEVSIDDGTVLYHNETDGHWVMAWCFVKDDAEDDDELDSTEQPTIVQ